MKLFTNKKLIQKITIVMVFLILFNFITPNYVRAAEGETAIETAGKVIFTPVRGFIVMCCDALMNGLQYLFASNQKAVLSAKDVLQQQENFLGEDATEPEGFFETIGDFFGKETILGDIALNLGGFEELPNFKYTPQSIFEGSIKAFKINFISAGKSNSEKNDSNNTSTSTDDSSITESKWYAAYGKIVEQLKNDINTAWKDGNEDKANAALQILKFMGVSGVNGIGTTKDINKLTYNPLEAQNAVKSLATKYFNGENRYTLFGFDESFKAESNKYGLQYVDNTMLIGMLGVYKQEAGVADSSPTMGPERDYDSEAPVNALHDMIATWYKIMRNIAIVFLLSILVYVGIRIMLSSTAADSAKYKKMLIDWVVALCILFALHYIMAFVNTAVEVVTDMFSTGSNNASWVDSSIGAVRLKLQGDTLSDQIFYTIIYLVFVIYTGVFTFYYLKRVVYAAFLTLIAPLVALTYPLDRMGDGKSQAFDFWLKEYIANAIIQPVHLLIYTVLVSSVFSLAESNPLYALVVMGAMMPAEKFIREMFGLNSKKGPGPAGGLAGGALAMNAFGKLMRGKPPIPHPDKNKSSSGNASAEKEKKPRTQTTKDANSADYGAIIDEGDFDKSNENPSDKGNEETGTSQPKWNSNLSEDQIDELKEEGLEPGDLEYDNYLSSHGIKDSANEQNDDINMADDNQSDNIIQDMPLEDDNSIQENMNTVNEKANIDNVAQQDNSKPEKKKIKPSDQAKRRAKAAKKQYYRDKRKGEWRKVGRVALSLGKGAVRLAGTAVGVTAGASVALGATIASGDVDKFGTNLATGVLAGAKGGKTAADFAIGTTGAITSGVIGGVSSGLEARQAYKDTLMKEDKDYKKAQEKKQIHKIAHSMETKSKLKAYYGKLDEEERKEKLNKIEEYMNFGVKNAESAMKAMDLVDNNGFTEKEAMMAALQSERFEKDDDAGRDKIRRQMENAFLNASILNGDSSSEATRKSELQSDKLLEGIDRIHGVKEKEVGRQEKELRRRQLAEERKKQLDREEAARLNAEAQNNAIIIKNMQAKTKNGRIDVKNSVIANGHTGKITINDKEINVK